MRILSIFTIIVTPLYTPPEPPSPLIYTILPQFFILTILTNCKNCELTAFNSLLGQLQKAHNQQGDNRTFLLLS